jgi:hypothetical protein
MFIAFCGLARRAARLCIGVELLAAITLILSVRGILPACAFVGILHVGFVILVCHVDLLFWSATCKHCHAVLLSKIFKIGIL